MLLHLLGVNHRSAPVEIRERLALSGTALDDALDLLGEYAAHGVILSTCNRTEVYAVSPKNTPLRELAEFVSLCGGVAPSDLAPHFYREHQEGAARHLFRVAAGLDSMIVGESQILGQVRTALEAAQARGCADHALTRLFRQALRAGRRAREETGIGRSAASVSSAAVELARSVLGDLRPCTVLVVGAGETGKLSAKSLMGSGAGSLLVTNRGYESARDLAAKLGGKAVPFERMGEALAGADIVISATGAPHFVLEARAVREAMEQRPERPLFLVDIAVPRDIDPEAGKLPNVHLRDIDDLQDVSLANLKARSREAAKVERIVDAEMLRFHQWWRSLGAIPTIRELRTKAETMRRAELEKTLRRLPDLTEEQRARVGALTRAIVNRVLHDPIARLRKGEDENTQMVRELFALEDE